MSNSVSPMGHNSCFVMQVSDRPTVMSKFTTKMGTFGQTIKPSRILQEGAVMVIPACRCMLENRSVQQCSTHLFFDEAVIFYPGEYEKIPESQALNLLRKHTAAF